MMKSTRIVQGTSELLAFWAQLGKMLDVEGDWSVQYAKSNGLIVVPIEHYNYITQDYVERIISCFSSRGEKLLLTRAEFLQNSFVETEPTFESFMKGMDHYDTGQLLLVSNTFHWGIIETDEAFDLFLGKRKSLRSFLTKDPSVVLAEVRRKIEGISGEYPACEFYRGIVRKYCTSTKPGPLKP